MRDFATFDKSRFPIIVARYYDFVPTREEFLHAQAGCEEIYLNNSNFILLVDLAIMPKLPNEYIISQAKWVARMKPLCIQQHMRFVFYTPRMTIQLLMKTLLTIGSPGVPYLVTPDLEKAYAWADAQLRDLKLESSSPQNSAKRKRG